MPCQLERLSRDPRHPDVPVGADEGVGITELILYGVHGHRPHRGLHQKPPLRGSGRAVDFTAEIERKQVPGDLISER